MRQSLLWSALAMALAVAVPGASPASADMLAPALAMTGRFQLIDQDGHAVTEASYAGRVRMMTFGYTFCPDICPTTLALMAAVMERLGPDANRVVPIFVTVDARRDTPARLKQYVAAFDPRFVGLSGSPEAVDAAARNFRVRYRINPSDNGDPEAYSVDHSAGIYIMDSAGRFLAKLPHQLDADDITGRLRPYLQ